MSSYEFSTEKMCRKLNMGPTDVQYSEYGYSCAIQIMHYYRLKDMYDAHINNKTYNRTYLYKYYDYEQVFKNGFNRYDLGFTLNNMRNSKNNILKACEYNFKFYQYDNNEIMFQVCKNLVRTIYIYAQLFEKENEPHIICQVEENDYLNDMIYAFHLYYTMLNKEQFLSEDEMNKLINERHPTEKIHKFEFSKLNFTPLMN